MTSKFSLGKKSRIKDSKIFKDLLCSATFVNKKQKFAILAAKNESLDSRLGVIVSKKRFKTAVERNRLKRRVREAYRLCRHDMPGLDVVVVVKSSDCEASDLSVAFSQFSTQLRK